MKIIIIGASGRIGREIGNRLEAEHDIIKVGRTSGDMQCDYMDADSVKAMFSRTGPFDGLICVAGNDSRFRHYDELADDDYTYGFERKFLSQVRLLKLGVPHANDNASFIFSSGFLSHYPNRFSIATGFLNAAVDAFAQNVAPLLPRNIRVNVVSPAPIVTEDRAGHGRITAAQAAEKYVETLMMQSSGYVTRAWGGLENDPLPGTE